MIKSVDIFCAVIDNFGDIGVCWRLAQQMARENNIVTRLYVDNRKTFETIIPQPDTLVSILDWAPDYFEYNAADMVIEAFACRLPQHVINSMVEKQSIWIDLEYLTAEDWAITCHAVASQYPSANISKTLFFAGFDEKTGGLIREDGLISRRDMFLNDKNAQNYWRNGHFIPEIEKNCIDISLFCYKTAPIDDLFEELSSLGKKIRIFQPTPYLKSQKKEEKYKKIEVISIPFLSQHDYDYLLWTCHANFVRGEDSFVRAQFAGKPFVWNIYVQEKNAHLVKMGAFLNKLKPFYAESGFESLANLHDLWNEGGQIKTTDKKDAWQKSLHSFFGLTSNARAWTDYLIRQTDLCSRILKFAEAQIKTKNYR